MLFKKKTSLFYLYIFYLYLVVILINFSTTKVFGKIYKINNIEVSEPYELNFDKTKVIEKAFINAFSELISKITLSKDKDNLKTIKINKVKKLVDSFMIIDEKFIDNKYFANFEVDFDKLKVHKFLENQNSFSSIPVNKKIFILPILVNIKNNQILMFSENEFYNKWNNNNQNYFLLEYILPNEDLEDISILQRKINVIENYEFKEIISKYNLNDYIILVKFVNNNELKVLSKVNLNNKLKIITNYYNEINIEDSNSVEKVINDLKKNYEDEWKKNNLINTSIKLGLTTSLNSKSIELIKKFENKLETSDFVSNYYVESFNNKKTIYKIIYNNTPSKFISEFKSDGFIIDNSETIWKIK